MKYEKIIVLNKPTDSDYIDGELRLIQCMRENIKETSATLKFYSIERAAFINDPSNPPQVKFRDGTTIRHFSGAAVRLIWETEESCCEKCKCDACYKTSNYSNYNKKTYCKDCGANEDQCHQYSYLHNAWFCDSCWQKRR